MNTGRYCPRHPELETHLLSTTNPIRNFCPACDYRYTDEECLPRPKEAVDHPSHYGGKDNPYEHIKVAEAWGLGYHLGNATKYLSRAGKKGAAKEDLKKALWYIVRARTFGVRRPTGELFKLSPTNVAEAWGLSPALANVLEETVAGSYGVAEKRLQEIIDEG